MIIRICRHILPSGDRCQGAAVRGRTFCRHHLLSRTRLHKMAHARRRIRILNLPRFLDEQAIRRATTALRISRAANRIDDSTWRMIAWALRMATDSLRFDQREQRQRAPSSLANRQSKPKSLYHLQKSHSVLTAYMPNDA
jgi:hypothetical protein